MIYEREVEARLRRMVEAEGGLCLKFTSTQSGVPDRIVIMPGGRVAFVELKRPQGRVVPLQRYWKARFSELGAESAVLSSEEEVDAFVESLRVDA